MANDIVIGRMRAVLSADTAQWMGGLRTASAEFSKFQTKTKASADSMIAGMSAAGKAASSSMQIVAGMSSAGREAAAAQTLAAQAAMGYGQKLRAMGSDALAAAQGTGLLGGSIGSMVLSFGSLAIVGHVVGFFTDLASHAFESASKLQDLAGKTGLSTTALQQMEFVAAQTGGTLEQFTKAAFMLGVRIEGGSKSVIEAVKDIGLNFEQLKAMSPEDQFNAVVAALEKIEDPQLRNAAAMTLFGKSAQAILPAVAEGYSEIAKKAYIAGDAQIAALDAAGDAWTGFIKNTETRFTNMMGTMVLAAQGFAQSGWLDRLTALNPFNPTGQAMALAGMATKGAAAAAMAKAAEEQHRKGAQAAKLAAQALGVSTDDLETKYGLTDGALRILNQQTRDYKKTLKDTTSDQKAWADAVSDVTDKMHKLAVENANAMMTGQRKQAEKTADQMLASFNRRTQAERDAANTSRDIEFERAEFAIEQAKRNGASWQQIYAMERQLAEQRLQAAIDDANLEFEIRTAGIDRTTAFGEAEYEALKQAHDLKIQQMVEKHQEAETLKRAELAKTHNVWLRSMDGVRQMMDSAQKSLSDNLASMLLGAKSFKEGFVSVWQSIKESLMSILSDILHTFISGFLKGMMNAITGQQGGFASAFGGLLGGGGGGIGGAASSILGGGGLFGKAGGGILGGILGGGAGGGITAGAGINATLDSLAAGGAGTGGGMGAAMAGLFTNPITAAAAGAAILGGFIWKKGLFRGGWEGVEGNKRRDQFIAQFGPPGTGPGSGFQTLAAWLTDQTHEAGGGRIFADLLSGDKKRFESAEATIVSMASAMGKHVQSFAQGGFIPPGIVQPAMLHGGSHGEVIAPLDKLWNTKGKHIEINNTIVAWDGGDVRRSMPTLIRELKKSLLLNEDGIVTAHRRALEA